MKSSCTPIPPPLPNSRPPVASLVTIAIPTYDRYYYLQHAVESALAQTWRKLEVLVGDDGKTTSISEWCDGRSRADSRLRYFKNTHCLGLAGNWNSLAHHAMGQYIVFLGDDDVLMPDFVEKLMAFADPNVQVIFSNHHVIDPTGRRLPRETSRATHEYGRKNLPAGVVSNAQAATWKQAICPSAALTRLADVLRLGFREELNSPDTEFFIRLAAEGAEFRFCPEYLAEYRIHPQSATATGLKNDRLVKALISVSVPAEIEVHKRECISRLIVNAVSRALMRGDRALAAELLASGYYPMEGGNGRAIIHQLCSHLPAIVGCRLYRWLLLLKQLMDRLRKHVRQMSWIRGHSLDETAGGQ